jgi:hypothetical protein
MGPLPQHVRTSTLTASTPIRIRCDCRLAIERLKKAAPSLDMQDAHRLGGRGKFADRYLVKGPTNKLHFMASLCGTGVEYFCQIAATCLKMLTNPIHCRSRGSGSCFPSSVRKSSATRRETSHCGVCGSERLSLGRSALLPPPHRVVCAALFLIR